MTMKPPSPETPAAAQVLSVAVGHAAGRDAGAGEAFRAGSRAGFSDDMAARVSNGVTAGSEARRRRPLAT